MSTQQILCQVFVLQLLLSWYYLILSFIKNSCVFTVAYLYCLGFKFKILMICDINKYFLLLITSLNILNFRFIMSVIYHSIEVFICTLFTPLWPDHVHEISSLINFFFFETNWVSDYCTGFYFLSGTVVANCWGFFMMSIYSLYAPKNMKRNK